MKPKALGGEAWNKLLRKYRDMSLKNWEYLDGITKNSLIKEAKIEITPYPIFGTFISQYPKDIYNFEKSQKITISLNALHSLALNERMEIGGSVDASQNINILFQGDEKRINLNVTDQIITLFHTHPAEEDVMYDPPSVLDIIMFIEANVKAIAESILEKKTKLTLKIQNCIVATKNELYFYYFSNNLVVNIVKHLLSLRSKDFIYEVEKLLEEIELFYSALLSKFNMTLTDSQVDNYIEYLSTLGIILKRFPYTSSEYYIF